jgi:hypothetical protein
MKSTRIFVFLLMPLIVFLGGCKYHKGDKYTTTIQGDSLTYLILAKGKGSSISKRVAYLKLQHEYKGDACRIKYVSDSSALEDQKGILFFNVSLPEVENDILTKGFFGSFTTKENAVYLLVSYPDVERYFRRVEK